MPQPEQTDNVNQFIEMPAHIQPDTRPEAVQRQPVIDGMPAEIGGMTTPEAQPPQVASEPQPLDPSKVIGHPSNPFGNAGAAYGEYIRSGGQEVSGPSADVGEVVLDGVGVEDPRQQSN